MILGVFKTLVRNICTINHRQRTLFNLMNTQGAELLKPYFSSGEQGPQLFTSTAQTFPGFNGVLWLQIC